MCVCVCVRGWMCIYVRMYTHTHIGKPCQSRTTIFDSLNEDVHVRRTNGKCGILCV